MKKIVIWIVAVIIAGFAASQSLSSVTAKQAPVISANAIPGNGEGIAQLADQSVKLAVAQNEGAFPQALPDGTQELAIKAFRLEPLNASAIRTVGLSKAIEGDDAAAREIMTLAGTVSKRERLASLWLVDDFGKAGNLPDALTHYDRVLRTSRSASQTLIPVMAEMMAQDEAVKPFADLLSAQPNWGQQFWQRLVRTRGSIENAAKLRTILADRKITMSHEDDAFLVNLLVKDGDLATARQIRSKLIGEAGEQFGLTNGDFSAEPQFAPLDWELLNEGEYGAMIVPKQGHLQISAIPDSFGMVARQILRLAPGHYALSVAGEGIDQAPGALKLRLRCSTASRRNAYLAIGLKTDRQRNSFALPANCSDSWIELSVDNQESRPVDIILDRISIEPVG